MLDFTYVTTENIVLDAEIILSDSSLDSCSSECVVRSGFTCRSFDYCPETKTCLLNSGPKQIKENAAQFKRDDCGHYRRDYFYSTSLNANLNSKDTSEGNFIKFKRDSTCIEVLHPDLCLEFKLSLKFK